MPSDPALPAPSSVICSAALGTRFNNLQTPVRHGPVPRVQSVIVAVLLLAEWTYLGFATPSLKAMLGDFAVNAGDFDWPYPYILSLHWSWCIPVGALLATGIIAKDRWSSRRAVWMLDLAALLAGIVLAALWIWGSVPHRIGQYVL